jgi:hypothetical protein
MYAWVATVRSLRQREKELHDGLAPDLQPVLVGKRLLLFDVMIKDSGRPDVRLVENMCKGCPYIGFQGCRTSSGFGRSWHNFRELNYGTRQRGPGDRSLIQYPLQGL